MNSRKPAWLLPHLGALKLWASRLRGKIGVAKRIRKFTANHIGVSKVEEEAMGWVIDMSAMERRGHSLPAEEQAAFETWLAADPTHQKAYGDLKARWDSFPDLSAYFPPTAEWTDRAEQASETK